jgi:hypothetical protein
MASALILPTEKCVEPGTIKRALLYYEKVYLKNPDDRDFVSGNDLMSIVANAPGMSMGGAPLAKPLGKERKYDEKFEKLISAFKPALREGSLVIMEKPSDIYHQGVGIAYHIDEIHRAFYWNYRHMLASHDFILAASKGLDGDWLIKNDYEMLAPLGGDDSIRHGDERLNNKVNYLGQIDSEEDRLILTRMVHSRIASISRNLMLCHQNALVPLTDNLGYAAVIHQMQRNFATLVNEANDGSIELRNLDLIGKVEKVMFTDFIDQKIIGTLNAKEILTYRSKMWGKYGQNKEKLDDTLLKIALDSQDLKDFDNKIKDIFKKFLKENSDYLHERTNLGIKLLCNIGTIATSSSIGPSLIQSFVSAPSLTILMALACPMTFLLAEKRIPDIRDFLKQQNELKKLPGYDLYNYFKPIIKK